MSNYRLNCFSTFIHGSTSRKICPKCNGRSLAIMPTLSYMLHVIIKYYKFIHLNQVIFNRIARINFKLFPVKTLQNSLSILKITFFNPVTLFQISYDKKLLI